MINKKGIVGSFLVNFIVAIIIAAILISFVLLNTAVKVAVGGGVGLKIDDETALEIDTGRDYIDNYAKLVLVGTRVSDGLSVENAIDEVEYEES